ADGPVIDLTLFRQSAFSAGNVAGLMGYAALFGLFFLMPFIFVRAYRDSTFAAGLRLSIVPVMPGVVAPIAGALYDRLGARLLTGSGMLICVAALALLFAVLDGTPASLPLVMLALAVFGAGQGVVHLAQQQRRRGRRARVSDRGGRGTPERDALLRHQCRRCGRVLAARVAARDPHGFRPQHAPRRSAALVGGGPRRDRPHRELRCHGGRDLARTT